MKKRVCLFIALPLLFLLRGCENQQPFPADLKLSISPDTLLIKDLETLKTVYISTQPRWKCDFRITQKPDWLTIMPMEGVIDGKMIPLTIRPEKTGLDAGTHIGEISIISDAAGATEVRVFMTVGVHPEIKVNISSINFTENINDIDLVIQNTGTGSLLWSFINPPAWLSFSSTSGTIAAGSSRVVRVTCRRTGLDVNTFTGALTINSNSEIAIQPIPVSMVVPAFVALEVPANILFHELSQKQNLILKNTGNTQLTWNAVQGNYLTLGATSGTLAKGESKTIEIILDRTTFQTGTYESSVIINYGSGASKTIPVQIRHFVSENLGIEGVVKDAEFCRSTNRIILVTTNPDRLAIIDPDTKTLESISLHSVPKCVAVNKAGDKAVVGHNGVITYVSLASKTIDKEGPVSCDVLDIVLTSTDWIYAFPVRDQWTRFVCVNPLTGSSSNHTGNYIYAGTLAKLHPSEKWIYGTNNGLSPSDIEKYNIESGTAVYSYDSPYHGDYPISGNLWFSETGDRVFTRGRTVLRTSADRTSDMIYNGSLPGSNDIWTLFHSGAADKIFYVPYTRGSNYEIIPASSVSVCNYTYLTYQTNYPLEKFIVPDNISGTKEWSAEGQYVFANNEGTKLYVIVKAVKNSGLLNEWAIQNISIN